MDRKLLIEKKKRHNSFEHLYYIIYYFNQLRNYYFIFDVIFFSIFSYCNTIKLKLHSYDRPVEARISEFQNLLFLGGKNKKTHGWAPLIPGKSLTNDLWSSSTQSLQNEYFHNYNFF